MTYPSDNPLWTKGVDVSGVGQPRLLSWDHIAANGERVAYVKSTEGLGPHGDHMADLHAEGADGSGLWVDYYHYLHSNLSGRAQAEFAVEKLEKRKTPRKLRFMVDCEDQDTMMRFGAKESFGNWLAFIERANHLLGERILLYTGEGPLGILRRAGVDLSPLLSMVDLEVAHYRIDPATGYDYGIALPHVPLPFDFDSCVAWQWVGNKGPRIPGIMVDLDRDAWFMSEAGLRAWGSAYNKREPAPSFMSTPANTITRADRAEEELERSEADTDPDSPEALAKAEEAKGKAS